MPKEERQPKAPEMTEDEKKIFKEIKDKKKQKEIESMRTETARRKALVARHHYVLSRMHHRYDRTTLPKDVEVGPAAHMRGGIDLPEGPKATLPTEVKPAAESQLQVRFTSFHPSPAVAHCEKPERFRWGKAPRTYRGLRKIWTAQDMATKSRTSHKPAQLVYTPIPMLALAGQPEMLGGAAEAKSFAPVAPSASAVPGDGSSGKRGGCGCRLSSKGPLGAAWLLPSLLVLLGMRRLRARARRAS